MTYPTLALRSVLLTAATCTLALGDYPSSVLNDSPVAYYRFNDSSLRTNINLNSGSLGAVANATSTNIHLMTGAIVGSRNPATYFDATAWTTVPWNSTVNPAASNSFTVEAWFYPTSDKVANGFYGPAPINNRYSYSGANRQGWVYFQRNPDASYSTDGQSDVGWNFRMYSGSGSSVGVQVTSQVPYRLGEWQHVVTVWDGPAQTLSMYINGVLAVTSDPTPGGYQPNTNDHDPAEAVNGAADLTAGSYNNTQPGSNAYRGGVDELAVYTNKLSAKQILAHYQNGTNAARALPYEQLIASDAPVVYLRLDDAVPGPDVAVNFGTLQAAGQGENSSDVRHAVASPITRANGSAYSYHWRNGNSSTSIPWTPENNPPADQPFTVEAWFRPTSDRINPGASPINNRYVKSGNRTGWVFFQRSPNDTYSGQSGHSGVGWNFRVYTGSGSSGQDVTSGVPYTVGEWQHVVATYDGTNTTMLYIDGKPTATNSNVTFAANANPTEDGTDPADLTIGSYNKASGLGNNPFEGDVDEVAIYNGLLTPDQILAHYQAGTNFNRGTNYSTLVLNSTYDNAGTQGLQPATYLQFGETAPFTASNRGTIGEKATGTLINTVNTVPGPLSSSFEPTNLAVPLDGTTGQWISLGNPLGLNISNQISLEAWIQPAATQGSTARIISHGLPTLSSYIGAVATNGSVETGSEVFLAIDGTGGNYIVGSSLDGTIFHGATNAIPAGDLGGNNWVHLVGTYDGASWNLFRNGSLLTTAADPVGAVTVDNADWAIGATGNGWADNFAGSIDEVAIYDYALAPGQVAAHYNGTVTAPILVAAPVVTTNEVTLTWTGGFGPFLVEYKADVRAPWLKLVTTTQSSVTVPAVLGTAFYRVSSRATDTVQLFKSTLVPANEVPPASGSTATGSGFLSLEGHVATYYVQATGLSANITAAHLHGPAPIGMNAGVFFHLFPSPNIPANSKALLFHGSQTMTDSQIASLLGGNTYFNVHSTAHPGGEIRGQVLP